MAGDVHLALRPIVEGVPLAVQVNTTQAWDTTPGDFTRAPSDGPSPPDKMSPALWPARRH